MFRQLEKPRRSNPPPRPRRGRGESAFTLLELLVVVAIVGLLAGVLIPSLARARAQARMVVCATNLRAIGQAWEMYLNANNDTFPIAIGHRWWTYGGKESQIWYTGGDSNHRPLNPFMSMLQKGQLDAEVFRCPADRPIGDGRGGFAVTEGHSTYDYFGNSYMMNGVLLNAWDLRGEEPRRILSQSLRLRDVSIPYARVVLAGDCQWYYTVNDAPWDAHFHNREDRMNILFLDGHVACMQLTRGEGVTRDYSFLTWYAPYGDSEEPDAQGD